MPAEVNEAFVTAKCDFFTQVQIWPLKQKLNPAFWLANFLPEEMHYAIHLLNGFLYYSNPLLDELFAAAFQSLSKRLVPPTDSYLTAQASWRAFVDSVLITHVSGEEPSTTDSGYIFARKARQTLGIREEHILTQKQTIQALTRSAGWPVVFVDDFVGSGNQFIETWHRRFRISAVRAISFDDLARARGGIYCYCPLVCTDYGLREIQKRCPQVIVSAAHIIPNCYSALDPDSIIWPANLRSPGAQFVREASLRAGIPDTDGAQVDDWQGFHKRGLALAFEHSVPDATMPIFYWEKNGWRPLIRRA